MDQKQQIADRLKQANNILVTVSSSPSVDQLAACIGLTLVLNKMGKHATAVFSGAVPSTIEFLQPEQTLETNTDSLRDFIISLDKAKADKLRYKVEDKVVKIFITPYRTSITDKDLEFGQGDFNVDVVVALGVHAQTELDEAITSHGRILHDAAIVTLNVKPGGELGAINWLEPEASSLSELAAELVDLLDKTLIDPQIATSFLTGIVAETGRFGNDKTSPMTMSISAELMAAGANQQLVASKLEGPAPAVEGQAPASDQPSAPSDTPVDIPKSEDGTLEIAHIDTPEEKPEESQPAETALAESVEVNVEPAEPKEPEDPTKQQIDIDDQGSLRTMAELQNKAEASTDPTQHLGGSHMILQPPTMGGTMTDPLSLPQPADEQPSGAPMPSPSTLDTSASPGPAPSAPGMLSHESFGPPADLSAPPDLPVPTTQPVSPAPAFDPAPPPAPTPSVPFSALGDTPGTLSVPSEPPAIAESVAAAVVPNEMHITNARDAVTQAIAGQTPAPQPIQALNAQPLGDPLHGFGNDASSAPQSIPSPQMSAPTSPPPPVPPPMMPTIPQA